MNEKLSEYNKERSIGSRRFAPHGTRTYLEEILIHPRQLSARTVITPIKLAVRSPTVEDNTGHLLLRGQ